MFFSSVISTFLLHHALLLSPLVSAASKEDWSRRRIYQVLTDRFALSDSSSTPCDTSQVKYCGGSWKGITNHLDYIQNMGFDAVWISPVVANVEGVTQYGEAYHGYWQQDLNRLNQHFGTEADLKDLSAQLHSRGMYLMVDVVANHFGAIPAPDGSIDLSGYVPFSTNSSYHPRCFIDQADYTTNQTRVENCWLGTESVPLLDVDTEQPAIVQTLNDWIKNLVAEYQIDGLRIDTIKHVRKDFWDGFAQASGVYTLGEVFMDSVPYVADYTTHVDGVFDYPTYFLVRSGFTSTSGNLSALAEIHIQSQTAYNNGLQYSGSFVENHDLPRIQSFTKDPSLVKNALTWPFVQDGLPVLYYGQEQGYDGADEPASREALWFSGYATTDKPLVSHVKALNQARELAGSANSKFYSTPSTVVSQSSNNLLAISKPPLLTLFTNVGASNSTNSASTNSNESLSWTVPASSNLFKANEVLVDILSCRTVNVDGSATLSVPVSLKNGEPVVLISSGVLKKDGKLCPGQATAGGSGSGGNTGGATRAGGVVGGLGLAIGMLGLLMTFA